MPGNTQHADRGLSAENWRRKRVCQALHQRVAGRIEAGHNRTASNKLLIAASCLMDVQVDGGISPPRDARRRDETAKRSREPVAGASRVSLCALSECCRGTRNEKHGRNNLTKVNIASRDRDALATFGSHDPSHTGNSRKPDRAVRMRAIMAIQGSSEPNHGISGQPR